ncbi:MAG: YbaB/EbfC family nucleoid-associated protein [Clostridiales bacterium]|nr:YbaB/EbfC family nucleoid-associated protein [Clostridiales bacterium]
MKARLPKEFQNKGASNMNSMIKQAQKMQDDMKIVQEQLEQKEYSVSVGGGAVELKMTGKKELTSVKIKPEVVDPDDVEMLEDLIISGVNEIIRNIEDESAAEMEKVTGGLNIPGIF